MTPKQARFVAEYLVDLNATQAAIRAGYHSKMAAKLVAKSSIAAAIAKKAASHLEAVDFTAQHVIQAMAWQVKGDIRRLFDEQSNTKRITDLTEGEAALIAGYEVILKNAEAGDGHIDRVLKMKLTDRSRYVEMAAKHFGLLTEKIEHSGGLTIKWQDQE